MNQQTQGKRESSQPFLCENWKSLNAFDKVTQIYPYLSKSYINQVILYNATDLLVSFYNSD